MSNTNQTQSGIQRSGSSIQSMSPVQMVQSPEVQDRFIKLFNNVHGKNGEQIYESEKFHFLKQLQEKPDLQSCSPLSLYGCFLDVAVQGLSLDPSRKLTYLIPRSVNVGTKDSPVWEKRCSLSISPFGELYLRQVSGQIKYADNPVIVYEGDTFVPNISPDGSKSVTYSAKIPNESNKIIACFIRIVRNDGSSDFFWLTEKDWIRLSQSSAKQNRGTANSLYTSLNGGIDSGFLEAKTIRHAFDSYPKAMIRGAFTQILDEEEVIPDHSNLYGLNPDQIRSASAVIPEKSSPSFQSEAMKTEQSPSITLDDPNQIF